MKEPELIYMDNHVLVADKPAGMLTQPNGSGEPSLEEWAKALVKARFNKPGAVFLHALHRLDRPVSGLVLFARTSKALSRLNLSMRSKKMKKTYRAQIEGHLKEAEGALEHYLIHGEHSAELSHRGNPEAKFARLHYKLVSREKSPAKLGSSWVDIELDTGRYHQIRIQFAAIGHPILGDLRYGSKHQAINGVIALQHYRFEFPHPISGEIVRLESQNPPTNI